MDVIDAINKRRALRKFDSRPVEAEKLASLVEAMRLAIVQQQSALESGGLPGVNFARQSQISIDEG